LKGIFLPRASSDASCLDNQPTAHRAGANFNGR
jgi:hypothetical protein